MARGRNLKGLEAALGYKFNSRPMLQRALTHASKRTEKGKGQDNERLEFLGDRVLALVIAELLTELDAEANEGDLARRFNRLVRKEACARVARDLGLGGALLLSAAEAESGGRDKDTILADACEALLAAIFLEGGFPAAREAVRRLWAPLIDKLPDVANDPKSALQEWAQGQGWPCRCMSRLPAVVPTTHRGSRRRCASPAASRRAEKVPTSALPSRPRRPRCWHERICRDRVAMSETTDGEVGEPRRCGFIAVVGAPNAGKSTLVNALVGAKVTIVSRKAQTTRAPVRGITIEGVSQLIFIDTPGIFAPQPPARPRHGRRCLGAGRRGRCRCPDRRCRAGRRRGGGEPILQRLGRDPHSAPADVSTRSTASGRKGCSSMARDLNAQLPFQATFMISALKGSGIGDLKRHLARLVPAGPWHFPEDDISDAPMRLLAAEITREKIYERLHDELPYSATVETTAWKDSGTAAVRIEQTIYVERESQRSIVLGEGGRTIKQISMESRNELGAIIEKPVHLFLFVKVREGWQNDPERYREIGLDFRKTEASMPRP